RAYPACANFAPAKNKQRGQPGDSRRDADPGKPPVRQRERCSACIRSEEIITWPDRISYGPGNCRRHVPAAIEKLEMNACARIKSGFPIHSEIRHPAPVCEFHPLNLLSCHRERPFEQNSQPTPPDKATILEASAQLSAA